MPATFSSPVLRINVVASGNWIGRDRQYPLSFRFHRVIGDGSHHSLLKVEIVRHCRDSRYRSFLLQAIEGICE
ncbi:unnamed protein product [Calypogeia fissa]